MPADVKEAMLVNETFFVPPVSANNIRFSVGSLWTFWKAGVALPTKWLFMP